MTELNEKYSIHQTLMQPTKLFGHPTVKDKVNALNSLSQMADISDIEYVYPMVFENSIEIAQIAAQIVAIVMNKIHGRHWNNVYDKVKYTKVKLEGLDGLMKFMPDISTHLLGIASLNSSGYIRERACI